MVAQTVEDYAFEISSTDGVRIGGEYYDTHRGPVGIFIHGFRSDLAGHKSTALARDARRRNRSWLRFDLRGHGRSEGEFESFRISDALDDLLTVLDMVAARPVILVGSSLGGWLAALAATMRPKQIAGMVLIAPAFNFVQTIYGTLSNAELRAWRTRGLREFEDRYGGAPFALHYDVLADAMAFDVFKLPGAIQCAVRIVHGADDDVVPYRVSERFVEQVGRQDMRLEVVPGAGHRLNNQIPRMQHYVDELWDKAVARCR
ncbi:MAG: lysophospholipase [Gammaproteobacteria bacterium]|nr:lysophospholipase [Gammaproteobacteria bacterium]MDH3465336.1 lysophospholipase [Gammaproteobacteria bacterium]